MKCTFKKSDIEVSQKGEKKGRGRNNFHNGLFKSAGGGGGGRESWESLFKEAGGKVLWTSTSRGIKALRGTESSC